MTGCTGVIHLAAVSRVIWGERDPKRCLQNNVTGTRNIIEGVQSRSAPQPWLIFASSREVYGQSATLPVSERSPLRPMNHYARSKLAGERDVMQARDGGLRAAVLRLSTVYGSTSDHEDRLVPAFCRAALYGLPLRVEGAQNSVDITHVADVAAAIADVAEALAQGRHLEPMHLTTGRATSLAGLARLVVRLARSESTIITAPPRDYDVSNFLGDPGLAQAQIGWRPRVSLEAGLAELIARFGHVGGQAARHGDLAATFTKR